MTAALLQPAPPYASLQAITGGENLMILVPTPGDESVWCGGLIAESCRRGRPPFVMVLGDGTSSHPRSAAYPPDRLANLHDRETRAAVACLGLPHERLLMAGVYDGSIPAAGPGFDAVVRAVTLVMWARDCNVVCAPWPGAGQDAGNDARDDAGWRSTFGIAAAVARGSGVGLLAYAAGDVPADEGWRLDITAQLVPKRAAVAAHALQLGQVVADEPAPRLFDMEEAACIRSYEVLLRPAAG